MVCLRNLIVAIAILLAIEPIHALSSKPKGNIFMEGQIVPVEVKAKRSITAAAPLKYNNKFACLSGGLEFTLAELDDKLHVSFNVIRQDIPGGAYAGVFGADETGKFMWCKSGWREAIIIDTESKKVIQKMASYNGNTLINTFYGIVAKEKYVYVSLLEAEAPQTFPVFDFSRDEPVAIIDKLYFAFILLKQKDSCLIVSYDKKNNKTWINATLSKTDFTFLPDDNLTRELTKKQVQYGSNQRAFNFNKNIILGEIDTGGDFMVSVSARWNAEKTDIKIEPLILQCPKPDNFSDNWEFSLDGNWCMNKVLQKSTGFRLIVFYKVDNAFPNGLSTPIYGGLTSEDNKGCFINHDVFGPLYLDIPPDGNPVVYKLNQIPELLKNMGK